MNSRFPAEQVIAALLAVLLLSCSANRIRPPIHQEGAADSVLVLQELPNGQVAQQWRRAEDFSGPWHVQAEESGNLPGRIRPVVARPRDCDQELSDCYQDCMRRPLSPGYGHIKTPRGRGGKSEYCRDFCRQAYLDCTELQQLRPQEFTAFDGALDWLKHHPGALLVGSLVIIAGVTFIVVSVGAGLLVLAPIALLASPGTCVEPHLAGRLP